MASQPEPNDDSAYCGQRWLMLTIMGPLTILIGVYLLLG